MLDGSSNIRLIDFGLSKNSLGLDALTTSCGSPHYACPEIIEGVPYDGSKTDVWSLGVCLYALSFGVLPFDNKNVGQLLQSILKDSLRIPNSASLALKQLLRGMLCKKASSRFTLEQVKKSSWYSTVCKDFVPPAPSCSLNQVTIYEPPFIDTLRRSGVDLPVLEEDLRKGNSLSKEVVTARFLCLAQARAPPRGFSSNSQPKSRPPNRFQQIFPKIRINTQPILPRRRTTVLDISPPSQNSPLPNFSYRSPKKKSYMPSSPMF
ncbi:hypothetical protein GEMRC1_003295 [Eukaryota sp. GEM-RC1]